MWKHLNIVVVALCLSLVASPALAQSWSLADDFPVPDQWPGPTNPPEEGDLWTIGNLVYPDTFQDFALHQDAGSLTGGEEVIGWGAGWLGGQTLQNQVGDYIPWNDDIWTELGELYIIPTSGRIMPEPPGTPYISSMTAQMFTPPSAGTYRVQGRFYGLSTGNDPLFEHDLFNEGPVKIIKGEYDHSNNQSNYLHEVLHDDWINGSVDSTARGGPYPEAGPNPESFFDVTVELTEGMPLIFAEGILDVNTDLDVGTDFSGEDWAIMRFGLDVEITQINVLTGDMDCDGDVDFDDIDDFVLGLNNPPQYQSNFGIPPSLKGDTDGDGDLDFDDITGFVNILSGGSQTVPEPSSLALLVLMGIVGTLVRCRRSVRR